MSGRSHIFQNGPPTIPERRISLSSPKDRDRKRQSLPASTGSPKDDTRPKYSNRVTVKPASPEVISSLIDTLSAISSPAEHHFASSLPNITESQSTPVSPSAWDTHFPRLGSSIRAPPSPLANGLGTGKESLAPSVSHSHGSRLRPGMVIEPPARRSSKVLSERQIKDKSAETAYKDLLADAYSIGTPSIERRKALEPAPKQASSRRSIKSLRSARSGRSLRSLAMKRSTESLEKSDMPVFVAKKEPEPKRERLFLPDLLTTPGANDPNVKKEDLPVDAFDLLTSNDVQPRQPLPNSPRLYISADGSSPAGPSHSRKSSYNTPYSDLIPTRNSSKRHSASFAKRKRRSKPPPSESGAAHDSGTDAGDEEFHTPPQSPPATIAEFDEDTVTRRIEELKERKAQRERLSVEHPVGSLIVPERKSRSPSPSPPVRTHTTEHSSPKTPDFRSPNGKPDSSEPFEPNKDDGQTAPSPAVRVAPPKTDKNTESVMSALKPNPAKTTPEESKNSARSAAVPQRSNSKLFKRGSRPMSPTSSEKAHRRRFSMGVTPPPQAPPPQQDSGDSIHDAVEDYLSSPRFSQRVANPQTGRVICFSEVGDPEGSVVFCCVGMGLTRYVSAFYDELATTLKLRLITPDRPGVGGSEPHADENGTPLVWPDDIRTICEHRRITKFSILAHSAGAIYALATALRMPQHIRCRVHLLAPWIPPSQMSTIGTHQEDLPSTVIPYSQRFLRSLPTTFFRVANSSFWGVTSNSLTTSLPRTPKRSRKKSIARSTTPTPGEPLTNGNATEDTPSPKDRITDKTIGKTTDAFLLNSLDKESRPPLTTSLTSPAVVESTKDRQVSTTSTDPLAAEKAARRASYENRLGSRIWDLATTNTNPAIDLLICLERRQPIGFRYVDITRSVVLHHGSKDNRVPVENVIWLGKMMRRCEVRVLEGEGHGLMASAAVMGNVLMEMAGEWEDWNRIIGVK